MAPLSEFERYGWLAEQYPELTIADDLLSGTINVNASFDADSGLFYIIKPGSDKPPGLILSGQFRVEIKGSIEISTSVVPLVYVADVDHSADRHFNQTDGAACLCSPLETDEFLQTVFDFAKFLDQLVVPFLYGQLYFDRHGRWPWPDYAHGATGLLEAYYRNKDLGKAADCLKALSQDVIWRRIKEALLGKKEIKGHIACFCTKGDHIRRCHPQAWHGIRQLRRDVRSTQITLP